jgi:hypothetical protein
MDGCGAGSALSAAWPARTTAGARAARPSATPPPTPGPGRRCGQAERRRHLPSRLAAAPGGPLSERARRRRLTAARATTTSWTPHSPSGAAGQGNGKRGPARGPGHRGRSGVVPGRGRNKLRAPRSKAQQRVLQQVQQRTAGATTDATAGATAGATLDMAGPDRSHLTPPRDATPSPVVFPPHPLLGRALRREARWLRRVGRGEDGPRGQFEQAEEQLPRPPFCRTSRPPASAEIRTRDGGRWIGTVGEQRRDSEPGYASSCELNGCYCAGLLASSC